MNASKTNKSTVVVALGGNALLRRGDEPSFANQLDNIKIAAKAIAEIAKEYRVVIVHGNGPQVGLLALQNLAYDKVSPYPLDVLGAESEGMIGYMLAQELQNKLPERDVTTLLTRIEVDCDDPSISDPTKFVGPVYDEAEGRALAEKNAWTMKRDGEYWRRVVPSPLPKNIIDKHSIDTLLEAGQVVIACGGGGIPVCKCESGFKGVEGVIDKDLAATLLAKQLGAEKLLILTDAPAVFLNWGKENQQALRSVGPSELKQYQFPAGSMGPKVDAVVDFAEFGGRAYIGALDESLDVLAENCGTCVSLDFEAVPA
ncbi:MULTISPECIES: carbamate kinase [Vibrio]|uniref:Carbamate kinase n=2 Tax=Vibrio TaxID=662 RepID=A0A241TAT0_9VIBR|nr:MULTISPECIES: carbamate kinase [Vibrio]ASI92350.1 carbamate kinase [Vibrio mediterranei]AYV24453.1 carbamate kinase [Vibrio mediterranei]EDL52451.1 carbamate kinase [Vibrio mediterranei AK1]MCF4172745.1 carbamate kinase [Vibrio sp. McD22-P3]MCG9628067.1 carbamate kinase [Vibrio mediterranei]